MQYIICQLCSKKICSTREEFCPRWRTIHDLALHDLKTRVLELHTIIDHLQNEEGVEND